MLNHALSHQSLARDIGETEAAFAEALEKIFAAGHHTPAAVAAALQANGVKHPNGHIQNWTEDGVVATLQALNATLDAAYATHGIGP